MTASVRRRFSLALAVLVFPIALVFAPDAGAEEAESPIREAGKHFQRGVVLYSETDYRAALVEFKRAYGLAPNAAVLYNIGETEYQLQDYAAALTTFKRYLTESNPTDGHRPEVEASVEVLKTRVGHLSITTTPPGAELTIDDQLIGKTPIDEPLLVSIGHRKVVTTMSGRPAVTRYVDVAADDNVSVSLQLPVPLDGAQLFAPPQRTNLPSEVPPSRGNGSALRVVGWVATGALTAGAVTFGLLANTEANDLRHARDTFPTTSAQLNHDASLTTTYSVIADAMTAAAVVVGGITLFSTVSSLSTAGERTGGARVMLGPMSARMQLSF